MTANVPKFHIMFVLADIFSTAQSFVTKLGVVIHRHNLCTRESCQFVVCVVFNFSEHNIVPIREDIQRQTVLHSSSYCYGILAVSNVERVS